MILDHISKIETYKGISERMDLAINYLKSTDLSTLEVGKHAIDGDDVYVLIQSYLGKSVEEANCEAHKNYIDIQLVIAGDEYIGYAPVEGMTVVEPYSEAKDRFFVQWQGTLLNMTQGMFAIFFPQDAHMPSVVNTPGILIQKAVVKIRV